MSVCVLSPWADSGRATPANATTAASTATASGRTRIRLIPVLRRRPALLSHMRYRFVDCRWSLDDPALGRQLYLAAHIPGAAFVDVDRDLSAPPGPGGRHPLPSAARFAAIASSCGIEAGVFVVAYGSLGGAERLWWLLRHFGHDDCAVIDLADWHGPLRGGDETVEPATFVAVERVDDTIDRETLASRLAGAGRGRRPLPGALAWRAESRRPGAGPDPRRAERPVGRAATDAAGRRARRLLRLRRHRDGRPPPPAPRRAGGPASTPARGRSGSSTRNCPSSAPPKRPWQWQCASRRRVRGSAPSGRGSSGSRA